MAYVRNSGPESLVHGGSTDRFDVVEFVQAGASRSSVLKPMTTGATSDDLKLQCVATATFST